MRLLVFGRFSPTVDATLQAVVVAARDAGHDVVVADIHRFVTGPVSWSPHTAVLLLGDVSIAPDDVDVVLLGPLPSAFARTSPPTTLTATTLTADEHDRRQKQQAARHALAWSVVVELEARGVPVVSSPTRARPFDHKPAQLAALARAGIAVPTTTIGDARAVGQLTKPVIGGVVEFDGGVDVAGVPQIVQQRLTGLQRRIVVVGDEVVAAGETDVVGDWRLAPALRWRPFVLDDALRSTAVRAAAVCAFDVAAIDLIHDEALGDVVLEVNRTPQVQDLAADLDIDIAATIVALCARARR